MKKAYLTIDDGPSVDWQEKLTYLVENDIAAVWFCTGEALENQPEFVAAAIDAQHLVGNHSYNHPYFSSLSVAEAADQIDKTEAILSALLSDCGSGAQPKIFRFPYGDRGSYTLSDPEEAEAKVDAFQTLLEQRGYVVPVFPGVTYADFAARRSAGTRDWWWTFDCKEWALDPAFTKYGLHSFEDLIARMDTDSEADRVGLNTHSSDEIVLIHDLQHSSHIFQPLIDALLAKRILFQSVSNLL